MKIYFCGKEAELTTKKINNLYQAKIFFKDINFAWIGGEQKNKTQAIISIIDMITSTEFKKQYYKWNNWEVTDIRKTIKEVRKQDEEELIKILTRGRITNYYDGWGKEFNNGYAAGYNQLTDGLIKLIKEHYKN